MSVIIGSRLGGAETNVSEPWFLCLVLTLKDASGQSPKECAMSNRRGSTTGIQVSARARGATSTY